MAAEPELTVAEHDALALDAVLHALAFSVRDDDLPLLATEFYSGHVLPSRAPGVRLDLRRTSFKKLAKLLRVLSNDGVLAATEKAGGALYVVSVQRAHERLTRLRPRATAGDEAAAARAKAERRAQADARSARAALPPIFEPLFGPTAALRPLFAALGLAAEPQAFSDISAGLRDYVVQAQLVDSTDASMLVPDALLCDALGSRETRLARKDLAPALRGRLKPFHRFNSRTSDAAPVVRAGPPPTLSVALQSRGGSRKVVTHVIGLEAFGVDLESAAAALRLRCAASTAVRAGDRQSELVIQGAAADETLAWLEDEYAIDASFVRVADDRRGSGSAKKRKR